MAFHVCLPGVQGRRGGGDGLTVPGQYVPILFSPTLLTALILLYSRHLYICFLDIYMPVSPSEL